MASAARNQLPGDKFWAFHSKLLATHGPVGKTEALAVARDLGLDMDKLAKDMESPEVKSGLGEVMQLADALQINGTPTFVVGQDVIVGRSATTSSRTRSTPSTSAATPPADRRRSATEFL